MAVWCARLLQGLLEQCDAGDPDVAYNEACILYKVKSLLGVTRPV